MLVCIFYYQGENLYEKDSCFVSSYGGIIIDVFSVCGRERVSLKISYNF